VAPPGPFARRSTDLLPLIPEVLRQKSSTPISQLAARLACVTFCDRALSFRVSIPIILFSSAHTDQRLTSSCSDSKDLSGSAGWQRGSRFGSFGCPLAGRKNSPLILFFWPEHVRSDEPLNEHRNRSNKPERAAIGSQSFKKEGNEQWR
jgi:hypothetical protein